ncbi:hypothetical protein ENSA7_32390 [Enhygromyxa salina]|uniref:Uncharacterized protein n=1 Tax=Enhygromyxa salina TaxID=215803 RepID=A0A2S9YPT9_9BACT|nr:hypothetical protein ENSA7_32390 [Enhygromyxa salina]
MNHPYALPRPRKRLRGGNPVSQYCSTSPCINATPHASPFNPSVSNQAQATYAAIKKSLLVVVSSSPPTLATSGHSGIPVVGDSIFATSRRSSSWRAS